MRCPRCGSTKSKVIDSRTAKDGGTIKRRRECLKCQHRYTTVEAIMGEDLPVRKADGTSQDFDRNKIKNSILKAVEKRSVDAEQLELMVNQVVESLRQEFVLEIPAEAIAEKIMEALHHVDKVAYVRFASIYKDFTRLEELEEEIARLRQKQ
jgi:transcriptional repressor NrdR